MLDSPLAADEGAEEAPDDGAEDAPDSWLELWTASEADETSDARPEVAEPTAPEAPPPGAPWAAALMAKRRRASLDSIVCLVLVGGRLVGEWVVCAVQWAVGWVSLLEGAGIDAWERALIVVSPCFSGCQPR